MKWLTLKKVMTVITVITLLSCTKFGKNITLKGRILNPITGEPYSGATITLTKPSVSLQYNGPGDKPFKSTTTDENGYFEISTMRLRNPIKASAGYGDYKEYYTLGWDYNGKYYSMLKVDKRKTMNVDYHLVPYGKLRLNINNVNCEGSQDTMWLRRKWQYDNDFNAFPYVYNLGCYNQLTGESQVPIGKYIYQIKVTRPSGTSYLNYEGIVHEGQTTTIDVFY